MGPSYAQPNGCGAVLKNDCRLDPADSPLRCGLVQARTVTGSNRATSGPVGKLKCLDNLLITDGGYGPAREDGLLPCSRNFTN